MKFKFCLAATAAILMGCNSEGPKDEDVESKLAREAMCVVSSERFNLYDEAKMHLSHGLEAGRAKFTTTGQPAYFTERLHDVRMKMGAQPKEFHLQVLSTLCGRELTKAEFNLMP